ncbi:MAG: hypothetical protein JWR18_3072 [Segetibacter sp.]|jgi:hypothetical protein|nr:hypothetical protein [Segetibacter sp.]
MVNGIIQDFYTTSQGDEKSLVKFLVKTEGDVYNSGRAVFADIPNDALKYDMVKTGSAIGWEGPLVFIEIEGVSDVAFRKVNDPISHEIRSYQSLKSSNELEEKGSEGM